MTSCVDFHLEPEEQALIRTIREMGPQFTERARRYDHDATSQPEDFQDLHGVGLLGLTVPRAYGGLGMNYWEKSNQLCRWALIKELAKIDASLARNWESHINATEILGLVGTDQQKATVFGQIVNEGAVLSNWASDVPKQGTAWRPNTLDQTVATRVEGGWKLTGSKRYANTAGLANPVIVWAAVQGAGDLKQSLMAFVVHVGKNPGLTIDRTWWDPMGMRASDAQIANFDELFVPNEDVAGEPGALANIPLFEIRHLPSYSSSFVGIAEAMLDFTVEYTRNRKKHENPHLQHRVGLMKAAVETGNAWMAQLADIWEYGTEEAIRSATMVFRTLSGANAMDVAAHAAKACGSTAFQRSYVFERMYRDASVYTLHADHDSQVANVGALLLTGSSNALLSHRPTPK